MTHDDTVDEALAAADREITAGMNAKTLAGVPADVVAWLLSCDPRFVAHTPTGVVLADDDGTRHEVSTAEYLSEHTIGTDEVFYALLDMFLSDIKGTTITSTERVVDALLDLRGVFQRYREEQRATQSTLLGMALSKAGA